MQTNETPETTHDGDALGASVDDQAPERPITHEGGSDPAQGHVAAEPESVRERLARSIFEADNYNSPDPAAEWIRSKRMTNSTLTRYAYEIADRLLDQGWRPPAEGPAVPIFTAVARLEEIIEEATTERPFLGYHPQHDRYTDEGLRAAAILRELVADRIDLEAEAASETSAQYAATTARMGASREPIEDVVRYGAYAAAWASAGYMLRRSAAEYREGRA